LLCTGGVLVQPSINNELNEMPSKIFVVVLKLKVMHASFVLYGHCLLKQSST